MKSNSKAMFNALSWNEFLLIVVLILTGYYVFVSLLFFRREIYLSVKNLNKPSGLSQDEFVKETGPGNDFLGKVRPEFPPISDHITSTDSDQLQFLEPEQKEEQSQKLHVDNQDALLIGAVADMLDEVNILLQIIVECEGDKKESVSMFQSLFSKHSQLTKTKFRTAINMFILDRCNDKCDFDLTTSEIDSWWPIQSSQNH